MADLALLACWLGLALAALVTQLLIERKKAPFPPSPFHLFRWRREVDLVIVPIKMNVKSCISKDEFFKAVTI